MNYRLIILGMMVVTFSTRYLVMIYFANTDMPKSLKKILNFVPPVILTAIIFPALFIEEGIYNISFSNLKLIAGILTSIIAIKTKNLLTTIVIGMLILWGLQILF